MNAGSEELQALRLEARRLIREHRQHRANVGFTDRKAAAEYGRQMEAIFQRMQELVKGG